MTGDQFQFETEAIHAAQAPDPETGAVMPAIDPSTTFEQDAPGEHRGFEYARSGNPTRQTLEENLAVLAGADHGRAFASGMAAINTAVNVLEAGKHIVAGDDLYGGTRRLFENLYADFDVEITYVDMADPDAVATACRDETELVWAESPTNPLLKIVDIAAVAEVAEANDALLGVDNTFATPYLQQPLELGADFVCHSMTKYLGGHSDVVGGALLTNDETLAEQFGYYQNTVGAVPDPFGCFLVLRGIKTLPLRMDRHCENAMQLAQWLSEQSIVETVHYPGLSTHPGHDVATKQMADYGGMVSFELDSGEETAAEMITALEVVTLAESLGGVESLIEQPAAMTHASVPAEERQAAGVTDGLIRVSVGIEHVADLIADFEQAFDRIA